ncbi:hypothetical protein BRC64_03990 [Halobacteriales archaeon QH_10_67_22]|nr:MAG: hypothetical protein BRC64_03990 [Halobacteriales archaeon QH_10_67_22]
MATVQSRLAAVRPGRETLLTWALVVNTELLLVVVYAVLGNSEPVSLAGFRLWVYPWIWINVAVWAVLRTNPGPASAGTRRIAAALAVAYVGLLAYVGGLVGPGGDVTTFRVVWTTVPLGWGPAVAYVGDTVALTLIPYRVVGYLALGYLVYATIVDAAGSAVTGVFGLLSCVSCSWPVLASLLAGVAGGGSGVAAAVQQGSYGLSTVVFVVTVALLYWRPFGSGNRE